MNLENVTHKPTRAVLEAIQAAGWVLTATPWPGNAIYSHPRSGEELPTPEYMKGSRAWPFDTFYRLRQITFNYTGMKIDAVFIRECAAPWVKATTQRVSYRRAAEYVREEWTP